MLQIILILVSIVIYTLAIFFMRTYINLGEIGPVFLFRIMIIVLGSWGIIFIV
jgi:hypothetical protein